MTAEYLAKRAPQATSTPRPVTTTARPPTNSTSVRPPTSSSSVRPPTSSSTSIRPSTSSSTSSSPKASTPTSSRKTSTSSSSLTSSQLRTASLTGTVPRGPTDLPTATGTNVSSSDSGDSSSTDLAVAITWASIGGIILIAIGVLIYRNKKQHEKDSDSESIEAVPLHPPVLRHPPPPRVMSGEYALSAAELEEIQAQEDFKPNHEEHDLSIPQGQPGSRFSIGSASSAGYVPVHASASPSYVPSPAVSSPNGPFLHRSTSFPMHIRPVSFSGPPANVPGLPLPPNLPQSIGSAHHPHRNSRVAFPVYVVPVTASIPIDPSLAYTEHPTWIAGVQYANTLPLSPSHRHSYAVESFQSHQQEPAAMTSIPEQAPVPQKVHSVPVIVTRESRPLPSAGSDVRQRQRGDERSPMSAEVSTGGQLPHSSSTFTLADL